MSKKPNFKCHFIYRSFYILHYRRTVHTFAYTSLKYGINRRATYVVWSGRAIDRSKILLPNNQFSKLQRRNYGMFVIRALRSVLKVRYLLLGGAVGGSVTLNKVN